MNVDGNVVGLVLLIVATVSGLVLFAMFVRAARGRERAIDAGAIAAHGGVGGVALATWFAFTTGGNELGGARGFSILLLAVVAGAGLLMLRTVGASRRDDPGGDTIPEAAVSPLHIAGHVIVGTVAIVAVVAAAVAG